MRYRIEFIDDLITLLDEDGNGYDAHIVRPDRQNEAERQLDAWSRDYSFNVASAKRQLRKLLSRM